MPSLDQLISTGPLKIILMGDSGTGKTGSLVSLVQAGYKLRILDFDSGLHVLALKIRELCPELIDNVQYRTLDDKYEANASGFTVKPFAWIEACKMINKWKYKDKDGTEVDLGTPWSWGPDHILVIDSLSFMSDAAFNWAEAMNPGAKDRRNLYFQAQEAIEKMLAELKAETYFTNVIVIAHIKYMTRDDGMTKGYPTSVGSALSPNIPKYFNSMLQVVTKKDGRKIQTASSALVDLKNPAAFSEELPLETGLAQFFAKLKGIPWTKTMKLVETMPQANGKTSSSTPSTDSKSSASATKGSPMAIEGTSPRPMRSTGLKL